jgi:ABC-type sulfate transport system permease component
MRGGSRIDDARRSCGGAACTIPCDWAQKCSRFFGLRTLAFTFEALVIGSVLYSMPFVVQPIRNAFEAFGDRPLEVAATLRASPWDAFWSVLLRCGRVPRLRKLVG